ncbi:Ig domain-containing protein [Salmonella enterica subsp. enterica]|uniref:Ig domain-containing protein n=1 Tax=Salmonella enterica I TaxID=59201 RepID=A0A447TPN7_SALET|nr:Ig domain-containing protein [Salmonella enterica subsp. enterica]
MILMIILPGLTNRCFIIGNVDNDVSHIVVHIDGRDYTIENTGGNLTFTPDQPLSDGQHTISVTVTDIAGNTKNIGRTED